MISSPVSGTALFGSSMPIVWARDGEAVRGGTLGAKLLDGCPPWDTLSGDVGWPTVEEVGLFCGPVGLAEVPLKRAFLVCVSR
jgi:hypothetical protein